MNRIPADIQKNPHFSGHETFPLRQLWLRKGYVAVAEHGPEAPKAVFAGPDAIQRFGVGKNMVAAIRHWALACDVIAEGQGSTYKAGPVGEFLFGERGVDPYLERSASAWLVHWLLAGRAHRSTTWFWVFNFITQQTFDRKAVFGAMEDFVRDKKLRLSDITLQRDIEVCIRCYVPKAGTDDTEEVAEPLLAELGLLGQGSKGVFEFRRGAKATLPDGVFAFALMDFWRRWERETGSSQRTLSFDALAHDYGSPGRVFKLDEGAVADRVAALEEKTKGKLKWSDSAGVRQVSRVEDLVEDHTMFNMLRAAYV